MMETWSGQSMAAFHGKNIAAQAGINIAVAVDPEMGRARIEKLQTLKNVDPDRVIGSRILGEYDPLLNIYQGEPLVRFIDDNAVYASDVGPVFDSRVSVTSSLNGIIIPDSVTNEFDWRKRLPDAGIAMFDYLISAPSDQIQYGVTAVVGGAVGGPLHRDTQNFLIGDYLYSDKPPLEKAARDAWIAQFYTDNDTARPGVVRAVYRKWDPYGAKDLITEAMNGFWINGPFKTYNFGWLESSGHILTREQYIALLKGRQLLWNALAGAMVLEEFGLCALRRPTEGPDTTSWEKLIRDTPTAQNLHKTAFNVDYTVATNISDAVGSERDKTRKFIAQRLGLYSEVGAPVFEPNLAFRLIGVMTHPLIKYEALSDFFSAKNFFLKELGEERQGVVHQLKRVQRDACLGEMDGMLDVFYQHSSEVVARVTKNSMPGEPADYILMH